MQLGSRLTKAGLLDAADRDAALAQQQRCQAPLGTILSHSGTVHPQSIYRNLAESHALPFLTLNAVATSPNQTTNALWLLANRRDWFTWQSIPLRSDGVTLHIASAQPSLLLLQAIQRRWPYGPVRLSVVTPRDIRIAIQQQYKPALIHRSRFRLRDASPHRSAYRPTRNWHGNAIIAALCAGLVIIGWLLPAVLLVLFFISNAIFAATLIFKAVLFAQGWLIRKQPQLHAPHLSDSALPTYTVLIPLYQEAASVDGLIKHLSQMDYPAAKLDIKLICEADDAATIAAIKLAQPPYCFELIEVPLAEPRTKPKACNFALNFARGTLVTIYDAEDRPDLNQLRKVASHFHAASAGRTPRPLGCVQCRLNYYNRDSSILTRWFALEYAGWFDYLLHGLAAWNLPIPLGGTSNHLPLKLLRQTGEWDPFNVTEDADLGLRIRALGYDTHVLASRTMEEAPSRLWPWLKQRTRWIKGYMQTWLVHMRHPLRAYRRLGGLLPFLSFQLFIGGPCFVFLTAPILWMFTAIWQAGYLPMGFAPSTIDLLGHIAMLNLGFGIVLHGIIGLVTLWQLRWPDMLVAAATYPLYWLLHSLASFRALWQLITRPYYWDKTSHGAAADSLLNRPRSA